MALYDINGNLLSEDAGLKPYYEAEMADTIAKVRALQEEPNITFFVVTDIHAYFVSGAETLYKTTVSNMMHLLKEVPCDGVINLGDSIEGYAADTTAKQYGNLISNEFRKIGIPYYSIIGNHDDNRYHNGTTDDRLTIGERFQLFVNPTRKVVPDATGLNFYVDFPEFKIRLIAINSVSGYTYKFDADTCTWFSTVALNTPDGYGVLLTTHVSPVGAWNYNNTTPTNSSSILSSIDAYAEEKTLLGILFGHSHVDDTFSSPYPGITFCCEKFENDNGDPEKWPAGAIKPQRTLNTYTEDLWTVVVVRPGAKKINCIRFGSGSDCEISYGTSGV